MTTKAQLEAQLAAMAAQLAALAPQAPKAEQPVVANLAIPDAVRNALVDNTVGSVDSDAVAKTMRDAVLAFAEAVPSFAGKMIPDADAADMAMRAAKALYATAERVHGMPVANMPEDLKKRVTKTVSEKKSRLEKLYRCAPLVRDAFVKHGFTGSVTDVLKLCTEIQNAKGDVAKVFADRKAAVDLPKDLKAEAEKHLNAILGMKGEATFLTAVAKARVVELCDVLGLQPKHANEFRNRALLG